MSVISKRDCIETFKGAFSFVHSICERDSKIIGKYNGLARQAALAKHPFSNQSCCTALNFEHHQGGEVAKKKVINTTNKHQHHPLFESKAISTEEDDELP